MKTKLIIMSLILSASSALYAGPCENDTKDCHKGEGHNSQKSRGHRMNDLNLSEEQQKSFEAIMKNKRESMKAAMEVIHADTKAELSKVLSAEQMQLIEAKHERRSKVQKRTKRHMQQHRKIRKERQQD